MSFNGVLGRGRKTGKGEPLDLKTEAPSAMSSAIRRDSDEKDLRFYYSYYKKRPIPFLAA